MQARPRDELDHRFCHGMISIAMVKIRRLAIFLTYLLFEVGNNGLLGNQ